MIVLKSTSSLQDFTIGESRLTSVGCVSESLVGSDSMDRTASGVDLGYPGSSVGAVSSRVDGLSIGKVIIRVSSAGTKVLQNSGAAIVLVGSYATLDSATSDTVSVGTAIVSASSIVRFAIPDATLAIAACNADLRFPSSLQKITNIIQQTYNFNIATSNWIFELNAPANGFFFPSSKPLLKSCIWK
jgi:hypothetical protein